MLSRSRFGLLIALMGAGVWCFFQWANPTVRVTSPAVKEYIFFDFQRWQWPYQAIFRMGSNGEDLVRLTSGRHADRVPEACSDVGKVAFISYRSGNGAIYKMNFDGSEQHPLTINPAIEDYARFSPDCRDVTFFSNPAG